jgi:hypothetical protein
MASKLTRKTQYFWEPIEADDLTGAKCLRTSPHAPSETYGIIETSDGQFRSAETEYSNMGQVDWGNYDSVDHLMDAFALL